jgi:ribosomal protein S18 acetylase RimI-like enzyme
MSRRYDHPDEFDALWDLKRAFERELGASTGGDDKQAKYEAKLDESYRDRYREWVGECVASDAACLHVAASDAEAQSAENALTGYAFVLPEEMAMIWDAAVLNEIYVREEHRGTGVADDLLHAAVETARNQNLPLDRMVLDVDPNNERAGAFYRRHGFEPWGEMVARSL